jgi:hypothetical protein
VCDSGPPAAHDKHRAAGHLAEQIRQTRAPALDDDGPLGNGPNAVPRNRVPGLVFGDATGELHLDEDLVDGYTWRLDEVFRETCHGRLELRTLS